MTDEEARCSMLAGYLASRIDQHFGTKHFEERTRMIYQIGIPISREVIGIMKESALEMGMPPATLEQAEKEAVAYIDEHPEHLQAAKEVQDRLEKMNGRANVSLEIVPETQDDSRDTPLHKRIISTERIEGTKAGYYIHLECGHRAQMFGPDPSILKGKVLCMTCKRGASVQ